jgi:hypothetical protein
MYNAMLGPIGPAQESDSLRFALEESAAGGPTLEGLLEIAEEAISKLLDYCSGIDDPVAGYVEVEQCLLSQTSIEECPDYGQVTYEHWPEMLDHLMPRSFDDLEDGGRDWVWTHLKDVWPDAWRP